MKTVELTKGIYSSVIGFGCAPILGSHDAKVSKKALEFAMDQGVNHLDIARSYGYGHAEKFVGKMIAGRRNDLVIASKFGIEANWKASVLSILKPIVRVLKNEHKKSIDISLEKQDNKFRAANMFLNRIDPLTAIDMRRSIETSLKNLKTDYLDYFFIHEPLTTLTHVDELIYLAEKLKEEGKIRAFGIAYMQSQLHLHEPYLHKFDLLQFNNPQNITEYNSLLLNRAAKPNVIFSPFRGGIKDLSPKQKIERLLIDFPESVILCSMFNVQHIKDNLNLVDEIMKR